MSRRSERRFSFTTNIRPRCAGPRRLTPNAAGHGIARGSFVRVAQRVVPDEEDREPEAPNEPTLTLTATCGLRLGRPGRPYFYTARWRCSRALGEGTRGGKNPCTCRAMSLRRESAGITPWPITIAVVPDHSTRRITGI